MLRRIRTELAEMGGVMGDKEEGGFMGLLGKANKWLQDQGVTKEDLEKAKAEHDRMEAEEAATKEAAQRADRAANAGASQVSLSGKVNGSVSSGLSAKTERDGDSLFVTIESVDPVPLDGGGFMGFTFSIPGYHGDGTYDLGTTNDSGMSYELWLDNAEEGFFWAREYGPGIVTVSDGGKTMQVHFVFRDPGSNQIDVEGTVRLG